MARAGFAKTKLDYFLRRNRSSEAPPSAASANVPGSGTISKMENLWFVLVAYDSSWKFSFRLREFEAGHQGHVHNAESVIGLPDDGGASSGTKTDVIGMRHFNFMPVCRDDFKRLKRTSFKIFFQLFSCHGCIFVSLTRYCKQKKLRGLSQTAVRGRRRRPDNVYEARADAMLRVETTRGLEKTKNPAPAMQGRG